MTDNVTMPSRVQDMLESLDGTVYYNKELFGTFLTDEMKEYVVYCLGQVERYFIVACFGSDTSPIEYLHLSISVATDDNGEPLVEIMDPLTDDDKSIERMLIDSMGAKVQQKRLRGSLRLFDPFGPDPCIVCMATRVEQVAEENRVYLLRQMSEDLMIERRTRITRRRDVSKMAGNSGPQHFMKG
jgi:hypothetical protein